MLHQVLGGFQVDFGRIRLVVRVAENEIQTVTQVGQFGNGRIRGAGRTFRLFQVKFDANEMQNSN